MKARHWFVADELNPRWCAICGRREEAHPQKKERAQ